MDKLILQMCAIVERKMTAFKSDFYKYDVNSVMKTGSDINAIWCVTASSTSLEMLNLKYLMEAMGNPAFRFGCMAKEKNYEYIMAGAFYCMERSCDAEVYHISGGTLTRLQNVHALYDIVIPYYTFLRRSIKVTYPDELKYYGKKIPIRFSSHECFAEVLRIARTEEGKNLIEVLKTFRRNARISADEYISIGRDFCEKSFTFADVTDDKCRLNGGIIYDKDSCTWSKHT